MKWPMGERDIEMLRAICEKERSLVAEQFSISVDALNQWIHRVRLRKRNYRWYLNNVTIIEKRCPHVKRTLLPTKRRRKKDEEW